MWYPHRTPGILRALFPHLTFTGDPNGRSLYLTFDDGPDPEATPFVLQTLDDFQAKATFFVVGDQAERHPQLVEEVLAAGHGVGNHTFYHISGWSRSTSAYARDVSKCQEVLTRYDSAWTKPLFRPPYGRITPSQARRLSEKYHVVMWSLLSGDFDPAMTVDRSLTKLQAAEPGDIIVFHDSAKFLPLVREVLPEFLRRFHDKGFKFAVIP